MLHVEYALGTILQFIERLGSRRGLMPSPLAHRAGFAYGLMLGVILGAPIVLLTSGTRDARSS